MCGRLLAPVRSVWWSATLGTSVRCFADVVVDSSRRGGICRLQLWLGITWYRGASIALSRCWCAGSVELWVGAVACEELLLRAMLVGAVFDRSELICWPLGASFGDVVLSVSGAVGGDSTGDGSLMVMLLGVLGAVELQCASTPGGVCNRSVADVGVGQIWGCASLCAGPPAASDSGQPLLQHVSESR